MDSTGCIEQRGVIEKISDGKASVIFSGIEACGNCSSGKFCELFGNASRSINVPASESHFSKGEEVLIVMKRSLGMKAAILAYLLPFILLILSLITGTLLKWGDLVTAIITMTFVLFYFIGLYFFRSRIKKSFTFNIQKLL
jgi:positive regulator of sigma E activity